MEEDDIAAFLVFILYSAVIRDNWICKKKKIHSAVIRNTWNCKKKIHVCEYILKILKSSVAKGNGRISEINEIFPSIPKLVVTVNASLYRTNTGTELRGGWHFPYPKFSWKKL